jgi:hypothetical protein
LFFRIGEFLTRIKLIKLAFILFAVVIIKTGISPIGSEYVNWIRETAKTYPDPTHYLVSSPLPIILMKIFGYPNDYIWWAIGSLIYIAWILLSVKLIIKRYEKHAREALLIFFASVPVATAATMMGHIDVFSLIGATIAVLSNLRFKVIIGALFAVGGNTDQSIATLFCVALLALGNSKFAKKYLWQWALISLSAYLILHLSVSIPSVHSPVQVMITDLKAVIPTTFGSWHLLIYSQMGLLWIPWFYLVLPNLIINKEKLFVILGTIILPTALTLFILDGTRVGTTVGYLCLLITFDEAYQRSNKTYMNISSRLYGIFFFIFVLTPSLIVGNQGILRLPIRKILEQFNII